MKGTISGNNSPRSSIFNDKRLIAPLLLLFSYLMIPQLSGQVRITHYDGTRLTWTNSIAPAAYKIETSTNLTRPWVELMSLPSTSEKTVTVDMPGTGEQMAFYRVVWSDAPASNPVGAWIYEASEGGTLTVRGMVTISSLEPFNSHLSFQPPAQPGSNHLVGEFSSQNGSYVGNTLRINLSTYNFSLSGQVAGDEINGTWTRISGGLGFPVPTPPRISSGTFRATRAP